jgi:chromate transporter
MFELFLICFRTSLVSFGGVYGALPELQRAFVDERHWISATELIDCYVVAQFVPGPNMVITTLIGQRVAGVPGAAAAFAGTYLAPIMLTLASALLFRRYRSLDWVRRIEIALRPLVFAFMGAAAVSILRTQLQHRMWLTLVACAAISCVYARGLLKPVPLVLASGAFYWLSATLATLH